MIFERLTEIYASINILVKFYNLVATSIENSAIIALMCSSKRFRIIYMQPLLVNTDRIRSSLGYKYNASLLLHSRVG